MTKLLLPVAMLACGTLFANTWYLAPDGNDGYDGTSSNFVSGTVGPKQSFESLMPSVGANDTIVLMPGEHCYGSMTASVGGNHTLSRAEITKSGITIRSYSGNPADTAIVGLGVESPDSLGDDKQIRCISIVSTATGCVIDGLTLKDGVACTSADSSAGRGYGGGVYDASKSCWLIGCVVTNCMAYGGGGVYGANAARTRFIGCKGARTAYGAAMYMGGTAAFCLFDRCEDVKTGARTIGGDAATTKVYNCTFVGAKHGVFYCGGSANETGVTVVNSVSVGNTDNGPSSDSVVGDSSKITARHSVFTACAEAKEGSTYSEDCRIGVTVAEARFCNAAAGDWRVSVSSPAATMGDAAELSAVTLPAGYVHKDLYGNPVPASGTIAAGCALAAPCIVLGKGVSDAAGVLSEGTNDLPFVQASSYTLSVNGNAFVRPVAGLSVNGQPVAGDDPWTVTIGSLALGESVEVSAVIGTNWYVNVNGGDDDNNGGSPLRAKHSIRAATTNAVPGDVVHVAEGVYDAASEGERTRGTHQLPQRVIVPAGVTVVADGRAEKTIICGTPSSQPEDNNGNGVGAVRCAYVGDGATLRNFTLTAGHSRYTATSVDADRRGSAALGGGVTSVIADCIVTGNYSAAGTLYIVRADRCVVKGNTAETSSAGEACAWYGCLFDDNVGGRMIYGPKVVNSCTIGSGNVDFSGVSDTILLRTQNSFAMTNCVMTSGRTYGSIFAKNCAFPTALSTAANITPDNCLFLDAAEMPKAEDGYVPSAASRLNNAGDMTLVSEDAEEVDLAGTPRVLNGGVDIGAFEHDWRIDYSRLLGSRRMQVSGASPMVVAQDGSISLNGGTLAGSFVVAEPVRLRFAVSGDGALNLYVKDVLVGTYVAGPDIQEVVLDDVEAQDAFRFEHVLASGEVGSARVFHCAGTSGLTLIIK